MLYGLTKFLHIPARRLTGNPYPTALTLITASIESTQHAQLTLNAQSPPH